jgi:uncharacterized membrane protein YbhN (UPF0104 family)
MRNAMNGIARAVQSRIGWNRIGIALSLLIMAAALVTLTRLLREVELDKVLAALAAMSPRTIAHAAVFVALGYVTLTFYDYFALRTIGRHEVPYRTAALASFASYSIGHNLGATVFTGGAVRLRIYSVWGLNLIEIAKIAFVTGLTFWLGNAFILGLGIAYAPEVASSINQLPAWINRSAALFGLATIVGYVLWLLPRPRLIGRADWKLTLPNARLTFIQIGIGVLDLSLGALAVDALLPDNPAVDFTTVLVAYVIATLLGFLSHAPGSLGVFDAAMLVALPQFDPNQLLASLLIFRVLYFILPFAIALCALGLREVWMSARAKPPSQLPPAA